MVYCDFLFSSQLSFYSFDQMCIFVVHVLVEDSRPGT